MNLTESLRLALTSIVTNRTRSLLTMLGIIIGVSSVIALVSLGQGVEKYVEDEFADLGANQLTVYSSEPEADTRDRIDPLTMADVDALRNPQTAPSVVNVGADFRVNGIVAAEGENLNLTITGVTTNMREIDNWEPLLGSYITERHIDNKDRVAVLGIDAVDELFGTPEFDPVGEIIRINDQAFTVVGVMEERGGTFANADLSVLVPISTAQTRLADARARGGYQVSMIHVVARNQDYIASANREIDRYLFEKHDIRYDGEQDYTILDQGDVLGSLTAITGLLTIFLGIIAGISLLVGGIGIMNIMLVTVTERTREIGLRKAIGAPGIAILMQFLMESLIIGVLGGVVGIIFAGIVIVLLGIAIPDLTLGITPGAVLLASGVSVFIGIFFGLLPARRAAAMRPIDALRFE